GYAFDRLLVFGTGGVGFLKETETRTQFITTATRASSPVGTMTQPWFKETADAVRIGWVLGAGGEYAFGSNWSLKAEYLYAHFGATAFDFPNARAGVVIANTVAAT
ncbi:MAG: outer membrane beta-barrel protein, partial [Afipia sp.]|nr:outer membrane beta-barrel protein [Afipia sp.]